MDIIREFLKVISKLEAKEIVVITREYKNNTIHFKIEKVTDTCFKVTPINLDKTANNGHLQFDNTRYYTLTGVIGILNNGKFIDGAGDQFTAVVKMSGINTSTVKLESTYLCLN